MDVPNFTFSDADIEALKAAAGAVNVDELQDTPVSEERPKRRGRPIGSKNKAYTTEQEDEVPSTGFRVEVPAKPLTKREEKDVATRLQSILTGATGMAGMVKPYLPMTEEEAEAIAVPLASYLVRNEATNGVAREILENYDLLAMAMGMGAYTVRVYKDRKDEVATERPVNTQAIQRVSAVQGGTNGREPDERVSDQVSVPDATRSSRSPFDL